ncbi:HEAT repeat domain-containing protein [Kitasatospora sp. NPDC101447]|uniref:HEAT repeat domain-containing protein n=1 Tax=Kitasatospora sp. NPDC101447 TaxID=3364102 RepID=UPI0037F864D2
MTGTGGTGITATERAALERALSELEARLAADAERGPDTRLRCEQLVEQLRTPAAAFLRPELERRLARHVDAGDSFARDRIAHALAGACGQDALPALLRAMVTDRNDDEATLQLDVLNLFRAWPQTSLRLSLECAASDDPGTRMVGLWSLAVIDFGGDTYFGLIADAARDPNPAIRAHAMTTLGTIFGTGDPSTARAILITGTSDAAPEVRRAAVSALWGAHEATVTDALVARAGDSDPAVRYWLAWTLSGRPAPEARAALERLTADEDENVRDAAHQALAQPTG